MADLLRLQRYFASALREAAVRTPDSDRPDSHPFAGSDDLVSRRLAIYRANVSASAEKALRAAYPVVAQVVGDEFFGGLAREHLRITPSRSGDLNEYGGTFANFLEKFEPARSLPYLPDLARVEWAVHRAYGAADAEPLDPSALAAIPSERQDSIRFAWAAGTATVESMFPLARIWAIHQPDRESEKGDSDFRVDWSIAEPVLIARAGFAVTVTALSAGQAVFYRCALSGVPLGIATSAALEVEAGFDLGALLSHALKAELITGASTVDDLHSDDNLESKA